MREIGSYPLNISLSSTRIWELLRGLLAK